MLYNDFSAYARDQERLISVNGRKQSNALDYLEGSLLINQGSPNNWRSSFFPQSTYSRIISLVTKHGIIYSLEVAKYYDQHTETTVDKVHTCPYMTPTFYLVVNWWCQINKTPQSSFNECNFFFFGRRNLNFYSKGWVFFLDLCSRRMSPMWSFWIELNLERKSFSHKDSGMFLIHGWIFLFRKVASRILMQVCLRALFLSETLPPHPSSFTQWTGPSKIINSYNLYKHYNKNYFRLTTCLNPGSNSSPLINMRLTYLLLKKCHQNN